MSTMLLQDIRTLECFQEIPRRYPGENPAWSMICWAFGGRKYYKTRNAILKFFLRHGTLEGVSSVLPGKHPDERPRLLKLKRKFKEVNETLERAEKERLVLLPGEALP